MYKPNLAKWSNLEETEGLLFFAQSLCEMLDEHSLDSFKAPALNLHLSFLELSTLVDLFVSGRIKKGSIQFSIDELLERLDNSTIFSSNIKNLFTTYVSSIKNILEKNEENINKEKIAGIANAAVSDIESIFWDSLLEKLKSTCKIPRNKLEIYNLCLELSTELNLRGFSKSYVLKSTKKFFFSERSGPNTIDSIDHLDDFLKIFDETISEWAVYFIGRKIDTDIATYLEHFQIKIIKKRPTQMRADTKYSDFLKKKKKKSGMEIFLIDNLTARDQHSARERAELQLNFFKEVCRFHRHNIPFWFSRISFVHSKKTNEKYIISNPLRPMECGITLKNAESESAINDTLEILRGNHFTEDSMLKFYKVLDFHHAAIISSNYENQLLDLWAALEGFLPAPDGSSDRISWYLSYILPSLTMTYNEKIFKALAFDLEHEHLPIKEYVENLCSDGNFFLKVVQIVTTDDFKEERQELLAKIDRNPLLRNRVDRVSKDYHSTATIRKILQKHKNRLRWHIQRIYTLRNQIAHNASSLPYIRNLVENLHDYLDTVILCTSKTGKQSTKYLDINTALEKISTVESEYFLSLAGEHKVTNSNYLQFIFGSNNNLNPFGVKSE